MTIEVRSEIGRLRRVLVHRPGREIDWMVPALMDRLLFDDILYGEDARWEHDVFRGVLSAADVEVLDPEDLLKEVLADEGVRAGVLRKLASEPDVDEDVLDALAELPAGELATALVAGLPSNDLRPGERIRHFYRLSPVPNYFFQRDPQVVMGDRVLVSSMATDARSREPYLSSLAFEHHPALAGWAEMIRLDDADGSDDFVRRPWVEGGDVLVPAHDVLMVGVSERTNRYGVDTLAKHLQRGDSGFRHLVVVEIPSRRSYMHLDTVFTFIDHGLCLGFAPVIDPDGHEASDVYRVDLGAREISYTVCDDLPSALGHVGIDCELVPCGGGDSLIDQQREQWTDGANAFAVAPGVILLYRRNRRTCDELDRRGFRVVDGEDVVDGKEEVLGRGRTAVVLPDNELSRARGGPRCMTMPLLRDPLA